MHEHDSLALSVHQKSNILYYCKIIKSVASYIDVFFGFFF